MNYSDLAKRCLNEATDLLNEGAQADAYKSRKREERLSKYEDDKHRRMNVEYSKDGQSKVYHAQTGSLMDYDSKEGRIISKAEKNGLSKNKALKHEKKMRDIAHKASEITRKEADRRNVIAKSSGKGNYDRDFDDNYQMVMDATNKHIRRHRTKHECIELATLLTEAALLLNDESNTLNEFSEIREIKNPEAMAKEKREKELEHTKRIRSKLNEFEQLVASKSNNVANDILKTLSSTGKYKK